MELLKMIEERDYVALKGYIENRQKEIMDRRIEQAKARLREAVEQKETVSK